MACRNVSGFEDTKALGEASEPHGKADRAAEETVLRRKPLAELPSNAGTTSTLCAASTLDPFGRSNAASEDETEAAPTLEQHRPDVKGTEGLSSGVLDSTTYQLDRIGYSDREDDSGQEYREDIYQYLREREVKLLSNRSYVSKQPDITSMRSDLVDWLVDVAEILNLQAEVLFLAVSNVDRFLSLTTVRRDRLKLIGTASMLLASKLEGGGSVPPLSEFLRTTGNMHTKEELQRMEQDICEILSFDLCAPTAYHFLKHLGVISKTPVRVKTLAHYLCELALLEDDPYLRFPPSMTAAAALFLANHTLCTNPWGPELERYSGYRVTHFQQCLNALHASFLTTPTRSQKAIQTKFGTAKYYHVASVKPSTSIPSPKL